MTAVLHLLPWHPFLAVVITKSIPRRDHKALRDQNQVSGCPFEKALQAPQTRRGKRRGSTKMGCASGSEMALSSTRALALGLWTWWLAIIWSNWRRKRASAHRFQTSERVRASSGQFDYEMLETKCGNDGTCAQNTWWDSSQNPKGKIMFRILSYSYKAINVHIHPNSMFPIFMQFEMSTRQPRRRSCPYLCRYTWRCCRPSCLSS